MRPRERGGRDSGGGTWGEGDGKPLRLSELHHDVRGLLGELKARSSLHYSRATVVVPGPLPFLQRVLTQVRHHGSLGTLISTYHIITPFVSHSDTRVDSFSGSNTHSTSPQIKKALHM